MEREDFDNLIMRKQNVLLHFERILDSPLGGAEYLFSGIEDGADYAIDIAIFPPTRLYNYYVATTVGLSCYQPDLEYDRCELFMALPASYKLDLSKKENSWPLELLHKLAYSLKNGKEVARIGQLYELFEKGHFKATDKTCGIVVLPEMFEEDMAQELIDIDYTRFFQFVPLSHDQLQKALDIGVNEFIEYDLHDTDGPDMVVDWKPKTNKKMDRIIEHNEKSLKGKL